jgi:hypothetical protein
MLPGTSKTSFGTQFQACVDVLMTIADCADSPGTELYAPGTEDKKVSAHRI